MDGPGRAGRAGVHLSAAVLRLCARFAGTGGGSPNRIEALLPPLLAQLSDEGRAILAEKRGLYLGTAGFAHETSEELAALGADLANVHERHSKLLHGNLRLRSDGWGMVNAGGASEIGFWPLYFGEEYFILVVGGMPRFNQEAFTTLLWTLGVRYGSVA